MKKLRVLVFDTETTGLPNKKEKDLDKQPYVIQFAGILVDMNEDGTYEEVERTNFFIKPPISIPLVTSQIHGIYDIDVINQPNFLSYSEEISRILNEPDVIVGHNVAFDETMIRLEYQRMKMKGELKNDYMPKKVVCTMNESINFCKLPKKSEKAKGYKRPKLQELVKKTCGKFFQGAHDAIVDVEWTLKAYAKLVEEDVIKLEENNEITMF